MTKPVPDTTADRWNALHPVGTPVLAWPVCRDDAPMATRTRTPAWTLGHGDAVVSVEGYTGGIRLTHIETRDDADLYDDDPALCGWEGCRAPAVVAIVFRNQPGHVHNCPTHEAIHREWCDVVESAPLPTCPWPHGSTWIDMPADLT